MSPAGPAYTTLLEILDRHQLSLEFPPAVEREVQQIRTDPGLDDPTLTDLTALPFVTIDYPDSQDLDQAMHIEPGEGGGFVVRYALADAAHFVRPGSALFAEAMRRGVSYYLPGITVPMLPTALCEDLVSLVADRPRRAMVFVMHLDAAGTVRHTELIRGRIRSRAKLSYSGVQAHHDRPERSKLAGQPYTETLDLLRQVGELRIAEARRRDVVHYDRVETEVELVEGGAAFGLHLEHRNAVSRWNEQISLLCNIEGARLMAHRDGTYHHVQPVYRVHEPPDPAALHRLQRIIEQVARAQGLPDELGRWRRDGASAESLADYLERLRGSEAPRPVVAAIERQALITGQRSVFSSEPGRHYALGVAPYARFSAPMREIVGIFTHKEALELLGLTPPGSAERDEQLRDQVIDAANAGKERQRRIGKQVLGAFIDQLLSADLQLPADRRPLRPATVLGVKASRLYVRLQQPPVELKVYTDELETALGCSYHLDQDAALVPASGAGPRFVLGDQLTLRVQGRDGRGRWRLTPVL